MKILNRKFLGTTFLAAVISVPAAATPVPTLPSIQTLLQQKIAQQAVVKDSLLFATAGENLWAVPAPDFAENENYGRSWTSLPPAALVRELSDDCANQYPDC